MMIADTAMLLAAGRGERMRPLTDKTPKPLVSVLGRTLLDRQLDVVERGGISKAVVNISYLGEQIAQHLQHRHSPQIMLSREESPLETGGGIVRALPLLGGKPFFSLNSDVILVEDEISPLIRMQQTWREAEMLALLLLVPKEKSTGYRGGGDFFLKEDGRLERRGNHQSAPYIFTGVQLLSPRLFQTHPEGPFSMNLLYDRYPENIHGIVHDAAWLHVGDIEGLQEAEKYLRG